MTAAELKQRYPNASQSFLRANLVAGDTGPATVMERGAGHAPLGAEKVQGQAGPRFLVRVTSIRKRPLDQDNLCEKYAVDLCRYAGIIPDDSPEQVQIEVCQRKAHKGEAEHTVITVYRTP